MSSLPSSKFFALLAVCSLMVWLPACGDSGTPAEPAPAATTSPETDESADTSATGAAADALVEAVEDGAEAVEAAADAAVDLVLPPTPAADVKVDQWGFAAMLPSDAQVVLGLDNLSAHLDGLLASVFWQRASLLLEEAMAMAPAEDGANVMAEIRRYGGQSALMAFGPGWEKWLDVFIKMDAINTRYTIQSLLTGSGDLEDFGEVVHPDALAEMSVFIEQLESLALPPLTLAVKPSEPESAMDRFWNDEARAAMDDRIEIGELELGGHTLVTLSTVVGQFLTEEMRAEWLESLEGETRDNLAKALDMVAAKSVEVAFGMVDGYLVLFFGGDPAQFRLATAADSILTNETFARLAPWQDKLRFVWGFVTSEFQESAWTEQPLLPVIDGLIGGLKEHETFSFVGDAIAPFRDRLATQETAVFAKDFTDAASISWWEGGFHGEDFGGEAFRAITSDVPLQFLQIANRPSNVFALAFNGDPSYSADVRTYVELWSGTLYAALQEAVRSGLLGEEAGQQFALFEEEVLPRLLEIYEGQRSMFQEGLGSQYGFLLDLNGRGPSNPVKEMIDLDFEDLTFLRFASMYDVVDREKVTAGWNLIGPTINRLVRDNPFLASPVMLNPLSMNEGDMKLWFYPTPVFNDEFLLSSAVNDKVMVIGTSRSLAADIRDNSTPAVGDPTAFFLKFDLRPVVEATQSWEKTALELEMGDEEAIRNGFLVTREWLSPFKEISLRRWKDDSGWRASWSIGLQDMVAFD